MIHSITVLAQMESVPSGAEAMPGPGGVVIVGFLFVIVVLALLAAVTSAMGAWFTKQAASAAAQAAQAAQAAAEGASGVAGTTPSGLASNLAKPVNEDGDPALMAVVAAAVHTVIGDRPHRVVSIRSSGPGWAQEGRRQIFSSHRVR